MLESLAKDYCSDKSRTSCTGVCEDCFAHSLCWGCEQYNMEQSYIAGATMVIDEIEKILDALHNDSRSIFAWGYIRDKLNELKEE